MRRSLYTERARHRRPARPDALDVAANVFRRHELASIGPKIRDATLPERLKEIAVAALEI